MLNHWRFFIVAAVLFVLTSWSFHDFHLSKTEIKYKKEKSVIQVSTHIFIDDLELALSDLGVDSLFIGTEKESLDADKYIDGYLDLVLTFHCEGDTLTPYFIGKELSEDIMAIWAYLEIENVTSCNNITITNKILQSQFDDQKNIVSFSTDGGSRDYFIFDKRDIEKTFSCE